MKMKSLSVCKVKAPKNFQCIHFWFDLTSHRFYIDVSTVKIEYLFWTRQISKSFKSQNYPFWCLLDIRNPFTLDIFSETAQLTYTEKRNRFEKKFNQFFEGMHYDIEKFGKKLIFLLCIELFFLKITKTILLLLSLLNRDTKKEEPKDLEYVIFFFELWAFQ
jgi:hypothetical protein